jgi:hypothetical protein
LNSFGYQNQSYEEIKKNKKAKEKEKQRKNRKGPENLFGPDPE